MADLPSAAEAIRNAVDAMFSWSPAPPTTEDVAAAVLRAAADQGENLYDPHEGKVAVVRVDHLQALAAELEASHGRPHL